MKTIVAPVKPIDKVKVNVSEAITNPTSVAYGNKPLTHDEHNAINCFGW